MYRTLPKELVFDLCVKQLFRHWLNQIRFNQTRLNVPQNEQYLNGENILQVGQLIIVCTLILLNYYQLIYLIIMSKFNVKFSYAGQPAANVQEIHRGPIHLNNLVQTYSNPKYEQINLPNVEHHPAQTVIPVVPTVDVESKPQSPQIIRAKSKEHLPKVTPSEIKEKQVDNLKPILNIEEVNESQFKNVESHKKEANHKIQNSEEIVLKAPSFKFQPKKEGDISRVTKKEYVRAENAQKYLYSGIPQKSQDEFVGCFGCMRKKPKSYSIQKAHK